MVFRVVPRGLQDSEEDVCAAAARAARLVTKRFLPLSWRVRGTVTNADELSSSRMNADETECISAAGHYEVIAEAGMEQASGGISAAARKRHSSGRRCVRGAEEGAVESGEGGGGAGVEERVEEKEKEVFHLVWKALGALHQDSACVEVRGGGEGRNTNKRRISVSSAFPPELQRCYCWCRPGDFIVQPLFRG